MRSSPVSATFGLAIAVAGIVGGAPPALAQTASATASATPDAGLQRSKLEQEVAKLREEVRQLDIENDRNASWRGNLLAFAPFVTALGAIGTLGWTVVRQQGETRRQREADQGQRAREAQQRFDGQFATAVGNLAADGARLQAAGASSLLRLQQGANSDLLREILLFLIAQLRIGVGDGVRPILTEVFQKALRSTFAGAGPAPFADLNLTGAKLTGIDLTDVNLKRITVCLAGADLTDSSLRRCDLWKVAAPGIVLTGADCTEANFGPAVLVGAVAGSATLCGARLASAKLNEADLTGADFRGAALQSTHFRDATLRRVDFTRADVNDAYFTGADIDEKTLHTLARSYHWRRAHFDEAHRAAIEKRAGTGGP